MRACQAISSETKVTYKIIQEYVEKENWFKVHIAYIAKIKNSLDLTMYDFPMLWKN